MLLTEWLEADKAGVSRGLNIHLVKLNNCMNRGPGGSLVNLRNLRLMVKSSRGIN